MFIRYSGLGVRSVGCVGDFLELSVPTTWNHFKVNPGVMSSSGKSLSTEVVDASVVGQGR